MSVSIPTTKEQKETNLANLEASLNQNAPDNEKSFLRVLAAMEALQFTSLYKFGVDAAIQNLALTATGEDLDRIGSEYGVERKPSEPFEGTGLQSLAEGVTIDTNYEYVADSNNLRYRPSESVTGDVSGTVNVPIIAQEAGSESNVSVGEDFTMTPLLAGAGPDMTLLSVDNIGADRETDDSYRRRILNEIRTVGGGGNSADYRTWAEEVAGVAAAFPYAAREAGVAWAPGDRTVYIEAETSIDPDRIAPQALLTEVKAAIQNNPDTGRERPPLGLTEEQLFVLSIFNTTFFVEVRNLNVDASIEAETKDRIEAALDEYFFNVRPWIEGLDFELDKNDNITNVSVSTIVQDVLKSVGGFAGSVGFGLVVDEFLPSYTLAPGELGQLGGVSYV